MSSRAGAFRRARWFALALFLLALVPVIVLAPRWYHHLIYSEEQVADRRASGLHLGFFEKRASWLPTTEDRAYVQSLMKPVYEPGKFADWIAPPNKGVKGKPVDFEYVKLERH